MVALGLLLLVLSLAVGAVVALNNTSPATLEAYGYSASGLTLGSLFLAGMAAGALALLGLWMMVRGAARKRARKLALKREVRDVRTEQETLAEENARLHDELEQERAVYPNGETADAPQTTPTPTDAPQTTPTPTPTTSTRGRHAAR